MHERGEIDEQFALITMYMDGTHCLVQQQRQYPSDMQYSYKLKDIAYNMLVINYAHFFLTRKWGALTNGWYFWGGAPRPCTETNDLGN